MKRSGAGLALAGVLAAALLGAPAVASAQDGAGGGVAEPIGVQGVLDRLVEQNLELRRAQMALERSRVVVSGEQDALAPVLSFDASYIHSDEPTRGLFEDGLRITDVAQGQAQLAKRFELGTSLALSFDVSRVHTFQPFTLPGGGRQTTEIGPNWSENLTLTLTQPLMRGFGRDVNTSNVTLAEEALDVAQVELERSASATTLEALGLYLELAYATEDVAIKERQLELLAEQREATEALIGAGTVASTERDVVQQRILVTEESILVSTNQQVTQRLDLERLLDTSEGEGLRPDGLPQVKPPTEGREALQERAIAQSPEVALLRQQIDSKRVEVTSTGDATLPQLDLTLAVGQRGLSDGFLDATRQIATLRAGNVLVGLTFSVPLGDDRAEAQHEATRMELAELQTQLEQAERRVATEVDKAWRLVDLGRRRVDLSARSVELARRNLQAEQARYRAGRSTNQVVLQYQEELERAELKEARSRVDLMLSTLQLRHLTGDLLESLGLEVGPAPEPP